MIDLELLDLERRRERAKEEERERQRRAELEGKAAAVAEVVPFEDFDLASRSIGAGGARVISRALTTGPGDYVLYVGLGRSVRTQARVDDSGDEEVDSPAAGIQ